MTSILNGHRHGETYDPILDYDRLNAQQHRVYAVLANHQWWTLRAISHMTKDPEASISARIRDLRKPEFGGRVVERRHVGPGGLCEYRLLPQS